MTGSSVMMKPCANDFSGMPVTNVVKEMARATRKLL